MRTASSASTTCCSRDRAAQRPISIRDFIVRSGLNEAIATSVPLPARPGSARRYPAAKSTRSSRTRRRRACTVPRRRATARSDEHRVSRADERQPLHDRSEQGRQRSVRDRAGGQAERVRDLGGGSPKNFYRGAADALGGLRIPKAARPSHPDHDGSGGLGRIVRRDAVGGGQLGQGEPGVLPDTVVAYCDSTIAFPIFCEYAVGSPNGRRKRKELVHKRKELVATLTKDAKAAREHTMQNAK